MPVGFWEISDTEEISPAHLNLSYFTLVDGIFPPFSFARLRNKSGTLIRAAFHPASVVVYYKRNKQGIMRAGRLYPCRVTAAEGSAVRRDMRAAPGARARVPQDMSQDCNSKTGKSFERKLPVRASCSARCFYF